MKFRFCLSFLLLLNLTACNDSKDSSAPAVANSITTESKKTVASESLSAVDSLQNFTVNIDAKNELKLSQDLVEVQKELERVKIEKSEAQKQSQEQIKQIESDISEANEKIAGIKETLAKSNESSQIKIEENNSKIKNLTAQKAALEADLEKTLVLINNYKQEVKKEQEKLESERHLFSESLLFFGYDTHEDDKEIMSKRLYEEHNVKQLNKEISDYVARVNFSANEIIKYNKQNEALKRRLEVHDFEENRPAKSLSLTIDTLKSSIEEKKKEILELNQEYSDYLNSISPKLELVHHMDNFYKAKKVFHQSMVNNHNDHNEVAVDFGKLIDLTIQKHFVYYKLSNPHSEITLEELHQKLTTLAGKMDNNTYSEIKPLYEAEIENELGTGLIYNKEYTTIVDIISEGKLQCYSGTSLYLILNFLKNPSLNNQVVISKDAHILPGYISIEEGKRILYGIETTAAGKATVKYGHTSSLQGKIRILDAKQYLLFDLYGFDNQKRKEVLTKMLTFSKEQYGINIEDLYSHDEEQIERKEKESFQFKINSSPLSFGKSAQAAGDIERQEFSQQDKTSTYEKVKVVEVTPIGIDENMESDSNYDDEYHKMILREIVISDFKYGNFRNFQVLSDESNDRSMKALVSSNNGDRGDFIAERLKNSKGEDIIKVTVNGSEIYHCNDPVFLESKAYETKVAFMDQRIMCNKTEKIEEAKKGNYDTEVALFYSF